MLHYLYIGRFSIADAIESRFVVLSPLDSKEIMDIASNYPFASIENGFTVDGFPFFFGTLGNLWTSSDIQNPKVVDFVVKLCNSTNSVVVSAESGCVWTGKEFGDHSERLVRMARDIPQLFRGDAETPN
ncbi:hypothetical protein [Tuwongella immobilis]|uniref:Uncharacterized protein n=1 Tax=Tuwongella immobilis TaxID=692036 RepID=A0A6C2YH08_9BACT|nr:hypothetical protein [Tuwongella immobilis]VIP00808.1 unnamed protein product [Tuwongella immobilis]VTR97034.1 unnamed protein product [Tuwongella immobilis]